MYGNIVRVCPCFIMQHDAIFCMGIYTTTAFDLRLNIIRKDLKNPDTFPDDKHFQQQDAINKHVKFIIF